MSFKKTIIGLDIETTDVSPEKGEIIEIAAVKYKDGKEIEKFSSLVKPEGKIPALITSITGIKDEDVKDAPSFSEIKGKLISIVGELPLIGHNIAFDLAFFKENGIDLSKNPKYDTWDLSTIILPGFSSYSLEVLTRKLDIAHFEKHRALHDARAGVKLFLFLTDKIKALDNDLVSEIASITSGTDWDLREVFSSCQHAGEVRASKKVGPAKKLQKAKAKKKNNIVFNVSKLENLFSKNGDIAKEFGSYEFRKPQIEMAKIVSRAFLSGEFLAIEAPPGVGKSLAYLMPSVYFSASNKQKIVISTHTLTLQNQLFFKDIPIVRKIVPFDFKAELLKGRKNYVCLRRFDNLKKKISLLDAHEVSTIVKVLIWLGNTKHGNFDEIAQTYSDKPVLRQINSESTACLNRQCASREKCFYYKARKRASKADLVIVNHALLLSDNEISRDDSLEFSSLIIDEAHALEEAATSVYGTEVSKLAIEESLNLLSSKKGGILHSLKPIFGLGKLVEQAKVKVSDLRQSIDLFFGILGIFVKKYENQGGYKRLELSIDQNLRYQPEWSKVEKNYEALSSGLKELLDFLKKVFDTMQEQKDDKNSDGAAGLTLGISKLEENLNRLDEIIFHPNADKVYWITIFDSEKFIFKGAPLRIGELLKKKLYDNMQNLILTSATLTVDSRFDFFKDRLALDDFKFKVLPPVFDYTKQSFLIVANDIEVPGSPAYTKKISKLVKDLTIRLDGHVLVLFTSFASIREVYERINQDLKDKKIATLAQGISGGRNKILDMFIDNPRSVILGTSSFWEGVDIPKSLLRAVVVAKLPFLVPSEPVFKARSESYENSFGQFAIPQAILKFKQGFGRLIRSKRDKGVIVILDSRIQNKNYGLLFLSSLPKTGLEYESAENIPQNVADWFESEN